MDIPSNSYSDIRIRKANDSDQYENLVLSLKDGGAHLSLSNSSGDTVNGLSLLDSSTTLSQPLTISSGGTGASERSQGFDNLAYLGNDITTDSTDNVGTWAGLGSGYAYYTAEGGLRNQPTESGFLISRVNGYDISQEFISMGDSPSVYVRSGDVNRTIFSSWYRDLNDSDLSSVTTQSVAAFMFGSDTGTSSTGFDATVRYAYRAGVFLVFMFFSRKFSNVASVSNGTWYTGITLPYKPVCNHYCPVCCTNRTDTYTAGGGASIQIIVDSGGRLCIAYANNLSYSGVSEVNFSGVCAYTPVL